MSRLLMTWSERVRALASSRRGGLAPIAALTAVALVLAAGSAVDVGRAARVHSLLQDDADSAALAGASQADQATGVSVATNYVNAALGNLNDKPTVQASYAYTTSTDPNGVQTATMKVALSASMPTTLMAMVVKTLPLNISATAQGAVAKKVTIALTNYSSDAADHNQIYAYGYDPTVYQAATTKLYQYAPTLPLSQRAQLDNKLDTVGSVSKPVYIGLNDNVAFALVNTTGTSMNCYGQANGTTTIYYSTRLDASGQYHDYPTNNLTWCGYSEYDSSTGVIDNAITQSYNGYPGYMYNECQTCVANYQNYKSLWNTSYTKGKAYTYAVTASRNPLIVSNLNQDCSGTNGVTYSWDDNGGGTDSGYKGPPNGPPDDDDHNDMVFTVTCTKAVNPSSARLVS